MSEVWKDIDGYEGLYAVSNLGNVKRVKHTDTRCRQGYRVFKERALKPQANAKGYMWVTLYKNNKGKFSFVHRLVAKAFIPNPNELPQINHKDENVKNNCADNLEWCSNKYNCNYGNHRENKRKSAIKAWAKRKGEE